MNCPNCGSENLKDGAATPDGRAYEYGCLDCMTPFDPVDE